jgi:hypothetical protein
VVKIISSLELDCTDPQHTSREYVTHEMAIDAGDKDLEGSISREEWERCGACPNCMFNQIKAEIIKYLQDYQKLRERVSGIEGMLEEASTFTHTPPNYLTPIRLCFLPTKEIRSVVANQIVTYLQQPTEPR